MALEPYNLVNIVGITMITEPAPVIPIVFVEVENNTGVGNLEMVEVSPGKFAIRGPLSTDPTRKVIMEQE